MFTQKPYKSCYPKLMNDFHFLFISDDIVGQPVNCYFAIFLFVVGLNDQMFGRWLSGNESVISVDMLTGKAAATGEGTTQGIEQRTCFSLLF